MKYSSWTISVWYTLQVVFSALMSRAVDCRQCTSVAEMLSCETAVTVKATPECMWTSVVAVTSRQISKCLAEESRSCHLNVNDVTHRHLVTSGWIEIGTFSHKFGEKSHLASRLFSTAWSANFRKRSSSGMSETTSLTKATSSSPVILLLSVLTSR